MIAILTAMEKEIRYMKNNIKHKRTVFINKFEFTLGIMEGKEVVLCTSGVGKVNAAICTQTLIDKFNPKLIILTGIAGSLKENVKPLSLVIGKDLYYYDVREIQMEKYLPYRKRFSTDERLSNIVIGICRENLLPYKYGDIVTGDDFIDSNEKKERITSKYNNALCVEMEGAAVCHTCHLNGVPIVVYKTISDLADDSLEVDYDKYKHRSSYNSGKITLELIKRL